MTTAESVPSPPPTQFSAQPARIPDVPGIHRLIQHWADATGDVLPRTEGEIYETLRDFFVVRDGSVILAAGALHIEWKSLAEIKSLVVSPAAQGQGLGRLVVNACLVEALTLDIRTVFALTTSPQFFERLGFHQAAVSAFPRKVWNECFRCPKYAHCDEVALSLDLQTADLTALGTPARE
jgi:amino-acid N-acetyltransferase